MRKSKYCIASMSALAMIAATPVWAEDEHLVGGRVRLTIDSASETDNSMGAEKGAKLRDNKSRIGVKGKMDTSLAGTQIIYMAVLEYAARGENDQTILLRDAYAGLKGKKWGQFRVGRLTTAYKRSLTKLDTWNDHVLQSREKGQQGASDLSANYFNNAVDYDTPKFGGVNLNVMYSFLPDNSTQRLHNAGKLKNYIGGSASSVGVKYENKRLRLTADALKMDADSIAGGGVKNGTAVKVAGRYKFDGGFALAGHYEDVTDLNLGTNIWVHATKNIGENGLLTAGVGTNTGDPSDNVYTSSTLGDALTWHVAGKYKLTKKSYLVAGYNAHDRDGKPAVNTITVGIDTRFGGI